jgi:hypothetical protein
MDSEQTDPKADRRADTRYYAVIIALMGVIILALAALWWIERSRRIRAVRAPREMSLPPGIAAGLSGAPGLSAAGEPSRSFDVGEDGRVVVRVREGDCDLTLRFASEAQFRRAQPRLFEQYQALLERLRAEGPAPAPTTTRASAG